MLAFIKSAAFPSRWLRPSPTYFASLAVALAFQAGLFNIGVEGQFYGRALSAVLGGPLSHDWPRSSTCR